MQVVARRAGSHQAPGSSESVVMREAAGGFAPDGARAGAGRFAPLARWVRRWRGGLLCVGLPVALVGAYQGFLASDQYAAQSRFVIRTHNPAPAQTTTLANLVRSGGTSTGEEEEAEVLDFLRSRDGLRVLDRAGVRARFATGADWLSRYPRPWESDRFENLYRYYGQMVSARIDRDSGVAVLEVRAFTPRDAHDLNDALLGAGEDFVNRLNERAQVKAISEGLARVGTAEQRLRDVRARLADYRNRQALIDPEKQAGGVLTVASGLVAEQAQLRSQLAEMQRAAPNNPAIPALAGRVAAIGREIGAQQALVVGGSGAIASKMTGYSALETEESFAQQSLAAANTALELARTEAARQQFYLERVVEPGTPDLPEYPHRLRIVLGVFAAAVCLYLIGWMLVMGILEHAPEDEG
jgi:capsular polysaccharide transport system permease protein